MMADPKLHKALTKVAVALAHRAIFEWNHEKHPVLSEHEKSDLGQAKLGAKSDNIDWWDILLLGHWMDYGQKHHFMRADEQSEHDAYKAGVEWIKENALLAANRYASKTFLKPWGPLADAIHALEDSMTPCHARRRGYLESGIGSPPPGADTSNPKSAPPIEEVLQFHGVFKTEEHAAGDKALWEGKKPTFLGRCAINAAKELIIMVFKTAKANPGGKAVDPVGWDEFEKNWLLFQPSSGSPRDLIAEHLSALGMDEEGLARALVHQAGLDTGTVLQYFKRLDRDHNSDADDVAGIYVDLVRKAGGPVLDALKANKALIELLIKVMKEGWTSAGEKAAIAYLKKLL